MSAPWDAASLADSIRLATLADARLHGDSSFGNLRSTRAASRIDCRLRTHNARIRRAMPDYSGLGMGAQPTTVRRPDRRLVVLLLIGSATILLLGPFDVLHSAAAQWAAVGLAFGESTVAATWILRSGFLRHGQAYSAEATKAFLNSSASFPIGVKAAPGYGSLGGWNFWPSMRLWISSEGIRIAVNPHYPFASLAEGYGLVATYAIVWGDVTGIARHKRAIEIALKGNTIPVTISRPTTSASESLEELLRSAWQPADA